MWLIIAVNAEGVGWSWEGKKVENGARLVWDRRGGILLPKNQMRLGQSSDETKYCYAQNTSILHSRPVYVDVKIIYTALQWNQLMNWLDV